MILRNFLSFLLFASMSFAANPVIATDGVVSVASYLPSGFPNSGIAEGSLFVVFGSGLGPSSLQRLTGFPIPTQVGGTSIQATVNGTTVDCLMIYSSAGQVAALLPSKTPVGDGTLVLTYNGAGSNAAPIHVVAHNFAAFTINQGGSGPAVATFGDYSPSTLFKPATPGTVMILWGTGLGPITSDETVGAPGGNMANLSVSLYVGGKQAQVQYQGRSPGSVGLDQINFVVPSGVTGCFVPVALQLNGVISNFTSIAISADGNTCSDPLSPLSQVLSKVESGQTVRLGLAQLSRLGVVISPAGLGTATINEDTGSAYFYSLNRDQFIGSLGVASLDTYGACVVWTCRGGSCVPPTEPGGVSLLDAGSTLTVNGPMGSKSLTKGGSGSYGATLGGGSLADAAGYLAPGSYTLSGTGGSGANAVGAFQATQNVGATPLTWSITSNGGSGVVSRSSDMTVQWSGGTSNGYVALVGTSTSDDPQVTGTFGCTAKGSSGSFTVPKWVLSGLPASGTLNQSGIVLPNAFVLMGTYPAFNSFSAPGIDVGFFTNFVVSGQNLQMK